MLNFPLMLRGLLLLWLGALAAAGAPVLAQSLPRVPYVPTPQEVVDRMLQMAQVGGGDYLIDLGSGDGRIVVTAARRYGTHGFGVDINPQRVADAQENARKAGVAGMVDFYPRDLFATDLGQATVISMYLLPRVNLALRPKLLALKPGTRIMSHDFDMGDWKPDQHVHMPVSSKYGSPGGESDLYLWVVPARVAGAWRWELSLRGQAVAYTAAFDQSFQFVSGSITVNGRTATLQNARLNGEELSLSFTADLGAGPVRHELRGRVTAGRIEGTAELDGARTQGRHDWTAAQINKEP